MKPYYSIHYHGSTSIISLADSYQEAEGKALKYLKETGEEEVLISKVVGGFTKQTIEIPIILEKED